MYTNKDYKNYKQLNKILKKININQLYVLNIFK